MSMTELKITIGISPSLMALVSAIAAANGIVVGDVAGETPGKPSAPTPPTSTSTAKPSAPSAPGEAAPEAPTAPNGDVEVDSAGTPYDPARHAGSKGTTKDGLWRMKVGVSRPEGEGKPATSATAATPSASPAPPTATPAPPAPPVAADPNRPADPAFRHENGDGTEQWHVNGAWDAGKHPIPLLDVAAATDDDEFAQFATGATAGGAQARTWTDADISKLCNQAAISAGNPDKIKPIIAEYMPADLAGVPHSRHVPADKREEFAQKVEAAHGITYAA